MSGFLGGGGGSPIIPGPSGSKLVFASISELITIAAAANSDSLANLLPANAYILGVTGRVVVAIPTAANFAVGPVSDPTIIAPSVLVAANTTFDMFDDGELGPFFNAAASKIRITPDVVPATAVGRVRVVTFYYYMVAPTS